MRNSEGITIGAPEILNVYGPKVKKDDTKDSITNRVNWIMYQSKGKGINFVTIVY